MKARQVGIATIIGVCLVISGQAEAQDRLVQRGTDAATGAAVRIYKSPKGGRIEVDAGTLRLRKQVTGNSVVTSLTDGREELVIAFDQKTFTVRTSRGTASATRDRQEGLVRAKALVSRSPLSAKAAALIGRLGFGVDSPVRPMLLTTRAVLLAASGDNSGTDDLSRWVRQARSRLSVVRVSLDEKTPTECWNAYAKEAIAAWTEYEDCMKDVKWWDIFGAGACAAVYDMRAIGAFSWWLSCVGLGRTD